MQKVVWESKKLHIQIDAQRLSFTFKRGLGRMILMLLSMRIRWLIWRLFFWVFWLLFVLFWGFGIYFGFAFVRLTIFCLFFFGFWHVAKLTFGAWALFKREVPLYYNLWTKFLAGLGSLAYMGLGLGIAGSPKTKKLYNEPDCPATNALVGMGIHHRSLHDWCLKLIV